MKRQIWLTLAVVLLVSSFMGLAGCGRPGSAFIGTWVNVDESDKEELEITHNGDDQFLITIKGQKIGATYKDGALEIGGGMFAGPTKITYVKKSDTLLLPGPMGMVELKRKN